MVAGRLLPPLPPGGLFRLIAFIALLFATISSSFPASDVIFEGDYGGRPIEIEAYGRVYSWEDGNLKTFCTQDGMVIRQGDTRISADKMAVWFDKAEAIQTRDLVLTIYAEEKVVVVERERVVSKRSIYAHLRSLQGVLWHFKPIEMAAPEATYPIYAKARIVEAKEPEDYLSDEVTEVPPAAAPKKPSLEVLFEEVHGPFPDPNDPGMMAFVFLGNVRLRYRNIQVRADNVVLWFDKAEYDKNPRTIPYEIYASGNVSAARPQELKSLVMEDEITAELDSDTSQKNVMQFLRNLDLLECDEIYFHAQSECGLIKECAARSSDLRGDFPVILEAKVLQIFNTDTYAAPEASFTTCDYGEAHYRFKGRNVRLVRVGEERILSARNMTLEVLDRPALYIPFVSKNLSRKSFLLKSASVGSSSAFGPYVRTDWDLSDIGLGWGWITPVLNLDYLSERGPGVGLDAEYAKEFQKQKHFGRTESYYIHDNENQDSNDWVFTDHDRGRMLWRHRSQWSEQFRTDAEFSYLTDRGFLREYYRDEYYEGKEQETDLYARYREDTSLTGVVVKARVNSWQTQVEHFPLMRWDVLGEPVAGGILNYSARNEAGAYRIRYGDELNVPTDTPVTARLHTQHKVSAPFSVGPVHVDPYQELAATTASDGQERIGPNPWDVRYTDGHDRVAYAVGTDAATSTWRVYDTQSELLKINRLRHIVTPEVGTRYTPKVWGTADDFIQFDELDMIDDELATRMAVRQRWQTKRGPSINPRTVDWMMLDLEYYGFPGSAGMNARRDGYVQADFANQLTDEIAIQSEENRVGMGDEGLTDAGAGVSYDFLPDWSVFTGYRYEKNVTSSVITALEWLMNPRWRLLLQETYDFDSYDRDADKHSRNIRSRIGVHRILHMWIAEFDIQYNAGTSDVSFNLGFSHKGQKKRHKSYSNW